MKKTVLFIVVSLVFLSLRAQITQSESDSIVLERMSLETRQYTIHAKENIQTDYTITTSQGEILELDYSCLIYYINYIEEIKNNRYWVVKESNGNLLEVKTKNNAAPSDLAEWRAVKVIEIPVMDYSLDVGCDWNINNLQYDSVYIINSQEDLFSLISCTGGNPTAIDFDQYSLLFVHGGVPYGISNIAKKVQHLSLNKYQLNIKIYLNDAAVAPRWTIVVIVKKMNEESNIVLNLTLIYKE
jgi:hypothetical protein